MSAPESGYVFPWEREAMQGAEMPEGLSIHDQMAYTFLRSLYHDYHEKRMDRATASAEKRRIFGAWDRAKRTAEFECKLAFFHARLYKETEGAKTAVRKDPSPENAIRLCNVLDGLERYRPEETAPTPPPKKKPEGARGLLHLHCPECGNAFGTFLREYQTEIACKCGRHIDLTGQLGRYHAVCPYCQHESWGKTNREEPEIEVQCKCKEMIRLQWVPEAKEYQN